MLGYLSISITQAAILPCRILRPESKSRKFLFILTPHGIVRNIHRFFLKNFFSWNDQVIIARKIIQVLSPYSSPFICSNFISCYEEKHKITRYSHPQIFLKFVFSIKNEFTDLGYVRFWRKTHTQFTQDVRKNFRVKRRNMKNHTRMLKNEWLKSLTQIQLWSKRRFYFPFCFFCRIHT